MDPITQNWPIPNKYHTAFDDIKDNYNAIPLRVFRNGEAVQMADIEKAIAGVLVEVQFELRHFAITTKKFDSFNASLEQMQILELGRECPPNVFKRKDMADSPIKVTLLCPVPLHMDTRKKIRLDNEESIEIERTILRTGKTHCSPLFICPLAHPVHFDNR